MTKVSCLHHEHGRAKKQTTVATAEQIQTLHNLSLLASACCSLPLATRSPNASHWPWGSNVWQCVYPQHCPGKADRITMSFAGFVTDCTLNFVAKLTSGEWVTMTSGFGGKTRGKILKITAQVVFASVCSHHLLQVELWSSNSYLADRRWKGLSACPWMPVLVALICVFNVNEELRNSSPYMIRTLWDQELWALCPKLSQEVEMRGHISGQDQTNLGERAFELSTS